MLLDLAVKRPVVRSKIKVTSTGGPPCGDPTLRVDGGGHPAPSSALFVRGAGTQPANQAGRPPGAGWRRWGKPGERRTVIFQRPLPSLSPARGRAAPDLLGCEPRRKHQREESCPMGWGWIWPSAWGLLHSPSPRWWPSGHPLWEASRQPHALLAYQGSAWERSSWHLAGSWCLSQRGKPTGRSCDRTGPLGRAVLSPQRM